jgi:large subunit ribosomal protein L19e
MNLGKQKLLAGRALGVSTKRVKFNLTPETAKDLKELISREGVKDLVADKTINVLNKKGNSRTAANKIATQKAKGLRSGHGKRKGTANARFNEKEKWMIKIRALRTHLLNLKKADRLTIAGYRELYRKAKGNFFRNKKHMALYIEQHDFLQTVESKKENE